MQLNIAVDRNERANIRSNQQMSSCTQAQQFQQPQLQSSSEKEAYRKPSQLPIIEPKNFNDAFKMLQAAWKATYQQPFPTKHLHVVPTISLWSRKSTRFAAPLLNDPPIEVPTPRAKKQKTKGSEQIARDIIVGNDKKYTINNVPHLYEVGLRRTIEQNAASHKIVEALQLVLKQNKSKATALVKVLIAGFATARPYISTTHIEHMTTIARLTLLWDTGAELGFDNNDGDISWFDESLNAAAIVTSSPSKNTINNWVADLAVSQCLLFREKAEGKSVFVQSDGGQKGQEVRCAVILDLNDKTKTPDGSTYEFVLDTVYTGKSVEQTTAGMKQSLV